MTYYISDYRDINIINVKHRLSFIFHYNKLLNVLYIIYYDL